MPDGIAGFADLVLAPTGGTFWAGIRGDGPVGRVPAGRPSDDVAAHLADRARPATGRLGQLDRTRRRARPRRAPRTRHAWLAPTPSFDAAALIPWFEGVDLGAGVSCWIPAELVTTDATLSRPSWAERFPVSSNGLGAGNTREAIVAGLAEVIERDAMAFWRARPVAARARTALGPAAISDAGCRALLDRIE